MRPRNPNSNPIGVFDSGIGGATVLRELALAFPHEHFIYIGDTARMPYGSKPADLVQSYSQEIIARLYDMGVKAIVIACNTASSQISDSNFKGCPIFNVIDPSVAHALSLTQSKKIGLIATRTTILSETYPNRLHQIDPNVEVISQSCPLLASLVEEGWIDDPITNLIVFRYLQNLLHKNIDVLILGCTHYPLLQNIIQKTMGPDVQLVHAGKILVETFKKMFEAGTIPPNDSQSEKGNIQIVLTSESSLSRNLIANILKSDLI